MVPEKHPDNELSLLSFFCSAKTKIVQLFAFFPPPAIGEFPVSQCDGPVHHQSGCGGHQPA